MLDGLDPFMFLRAAFLCALILLGIWPPPADAQVADATVSAELDAFGVEKHEESRSVFEEALEHCHPGLDCAVTAMAVESTQAADATG